MHPRSLKRAETPDGIPLPDRVVARMLCRLLMAMERQWIEPAFFARSLVACNGSLVWPENVLSALCVSKPAERPLGEWSLVMGTEDSQALCAQALIDPTQVLEVRSRFFDHFAEDALQRLMVANATRAWLDLVIDADEQIPALKNVMPVVQGLGLEPCVAPVLKLIFLAARHDAFQIALDAIPCATMHTAVALLGRWLGDGQQASVEALFADDSVLVVVGLLGGMNRVVSTLLDAIRPKNWRIFTQLSQSDDVAPWHLSQLLQPAGPAQITHSAISHFWDAHQLNCALFKAAFAHPQKGLNLLLYGAAGVGKSEYARFLAQEAGLALFTIAPIWGGVDRHQLKHRFRHLVVALRVLSSQPGSALLFDDAEDFFNQVCEDPATGHTDISRAWVHELLETTVVPVIWTLQRADRLPESVLRRFSRTQWLKVPPRAARLDMVSAQMADTPLLMGGVNDMVDCAHPTPARLSRISRNLKQAAPSSAAESANWIQQEVLELRRLTPFKHTHASQNTDRFNPRYLNLSGGPSVDRMIERLSEQPAACFCFHGDSGTGKTALAHHIAERVGRELMVRTASDLLSKWIGDTEQKIAAMFDECAQSPFDKILLLDEADTFLKDRRSDKSEYSVSHTNEFLSQMSRFPGTFICTTNLYEQLDQAVVRRFQFRIQFDPLTVVQAATFFEEIYGLPIPADTAMPTGLVAADFVNVQQQRLWREGDCTPTDLLQMLKAESAVRRGQSHPCSHMGFLN